jgi:hypothetical protein
MKLSSIFSQLIHGELARLAIGSNGIQPENYSQLIDYTNLALIELYKRFNLKEAELTLRTTSEVTTYYLRPSFIDGSDSDVPYKYIISTGNTQNIESLFKIEKVFDEEGNEWAINSSASKFSVFTNEYDVIQFNNLEPNKLFSIIYRCGPDPIVLPENFTIENHEVFDPKEVEINLPPYLLQPLLVFVAARAFSILGSTTDVNEGANYMLKFKQACNEIDRLGLVNKEVFESTKLNDRGWV